MIEISHSGEKFKDLELKYFLFLDTSHCWCYYEEMSSGPRKNIILYCRSFYFILLKDWGCIKLKN